MNNDPLGAKSDERIISTRLIADEFSSEYMEKENRGDSAEELNNFWAYPGGTSNTMGLSRMYYAFVKGDTDKGAPAAGAISGAVKEITSAGDVVRQVMEEAQVVLGRIGCSINKN